MTGHEKIMFKKENQQIAFLFFFTCHGNKNTRRKRVIDQEDMDNVRKSVRQYMSRYDTCPSESYVKTIF